MQGFEVKKRERFVYVFPLFLVHHILPFHAIATPVRIEPGYDGWKLSSITPTLCCLQQCNDEMSYLNQMHEKKAIQGYALMRLPTCVCMTSFYCCWAWYGMEDGIERKFRYGIWKMPE